MDYATLIRHARQSVSGGAFAMAASLFEQASRLPGDSTIALAGLGHCYGKLGQHAEAIRCLLGAAQGVRARAADAAAIDALLDISHELQLILACRESLQVIDKALKRSPSSARAHHLKAQALLRLNELQAARKSAARAHALAPQDANAILLHADLETRSGHLYAALALLEPLAAGPVQAQALSLMGRILDQLGDYDAAFEHARRAGLTVLSQPAIAGIRQSSIYAELDDKRRRCTAQWRATHGYQGDDGRADPVFLLGFYRSGTTLAEQILAAHPQVVSSDEADLLPQIHRELHRRQPARHLHWTERLVACGTDAAAQLRAHYWRCAEQRFGRLQAHTVLLDKTALNTINIDLIVTLFPRARIVLALRDPRDVLISCFMQAFTPTALTVHLLDWREAARFYAAVMSFWEEMRNVHQPAVVELRYEDVVGSLRAAFAPVLASLGLEWQTAMSDFHENARERVISTPSFADVTRPVYRSSLARWRHYAAQIDQVATLIEPFVARFGYARRGEAPTPS